MNPVESAPPAEYDIQPYGETAVIVLTGAGIDENVYRRLASLAAAIKATPPRGFRELVPAYDSLLFIFDPMTTGCRAAAEAVRALMEAMVSRPEAPALEIVEIPVSYGGEFGPDLRALEEKTGLGAGELIAMHSSKPYLVYMLGFTPGFPYLGGVDPRIAAPRLATPRTKVPAGSVGIAETQTGIYPQESPGGWNIVGRTPLRLFDPARQPPALLAAGKYVRFVPISKELFDTMRPTDFKEPGKKIDMQDATAADIEVIKPGALSTIQDLGRFGFQDTGVPPSGPMDYPSMRLANLLAGNGENEACIECTLGGLELHFNAEAVVAITGAELPATVNGEPILLNRGISLQKGSLLSLGFMEHGLRAYIAVHGGLGTVPVMGSRSTFVRGGFGGLDGKSLAAGDRIPMGDGRINNNLDSISGRGLPDSAIPLFTPQIIVRAILSHESGRFTTEALASFFGQNFMVSQKSDRMGCRLEGVPLKLVRGADIVSSGVLSGTVQVPPDGQPIVLMADRQTTGGYARIAHVIQADLGLLGQARPGTRVRFVECGLEQARQALIAQETGLRDLEKTAAGQAHGLASGTCKHFRISVDGTVFNVITEELG